MIKHGNLKNRSPILLINIIYFVYHKIKPQLVDKSLIKQILILL